jgi:hypothetical protein
LTEKSASTGRGRGKKGGVKLEAGNSQSTAFGTASSLLHASSLLSSSNSNSGMFDLNGNQAAAVPLLEQRLHPKVLELARMTGTYYVGSCCFEMDDFALYRSTIDLT